MPHWWIRILSSPPLVRLGEVRDVVADYPGVTLVGDTILYERGVTRFAHALLEVPDDFAQTDELLDRLKTVGSNRYRRAEDHHVIFPEWRSDDPEPERSA